MIMRWCICASGQGNYRLTRVVLHRKADIIHYILKSTVQSNNYNEQSGGVFCALTLCIHVPYCTAFE